MTGPSWHPPQSHLRNEGTTGAQTGVTSMTHHTRWNWNRTARPPKPLSTTLARPVPRVAPAGSGLAVPNGSWCLGYVRCAPWSTPLTRCIPVASAAQCLTVAAACREGGLSRRKDWPSWASEVGWACEPNDRLASLQAGPMFDIYQDHPTIWVSWR